MNPDMMGGGMPMNGMGGMNNMNGMGGMGMNNMNGMMGMAPNMAGGMARPPPGMQGAAGMVPQSQIPIPHQLSQQLLRQMYQIDRSTIPSGWQQTYPPGERVKAVIELTTAMRTLNPAMPLQEIFKRVAGMENQFFLKSPSKEQYQSSLGQKMQEITAKRQSNVTNLQQNLPPNSARFMGGNQGGMFPGGMANGVPNGMPNGLTNGMPGAFPAGFPPNQTPRPNQPPTPKQPAQPFAQPPNGMMPGNMPMNMPGAAGMMGRGPQQQQQPQQQPHPQQIMLTPEERQQCESFANAQYQQATQQVKNHIRQSLQQSMTPQAIAQLTNLGTDPILLFFKKKTEQSMMAQKANRARQGHGGIPPGNVQGFNMPPGMPGGMGAGGHAAQGGQAPTEENLMRMRQVHGLGAQAKGEQVVPMSVPGAGLQRTPTPNQPGMPLGFGANGPQVSQPNQTPGIGGQARPPGIPTTQGPNAPSSMQTLNRTFTQQNSPHVGQRTPNPGQNQPPGNMPQMGPNMNTQQLMQVIQNMQLPPNIKDQLSKMPPTQAFQALQALLKRQAEMNKRVPNMVQGGQGRLGPQPPGNNGPVVKFPNNPGAENQNGQAPAGPGMMPLNLTPEQQRQADQMPCSRILPVMKLLPGLPTEPKTWGQVKEWVVQQQNMQRLPPNTIDNLTRVQMAVLKMKQQHFQQQQQHLQMLHGQPNPNANNTSGAAAQPGPAGFGGRAPPAPMGAAGPVNAANRPSSQNVVQQIGVLTDEQCEKFRDNNSALKNMTNDQIRNAYMKKNALEANRSNQTDAQDPNNQQASHQNSSAGNTTPAIPQQPTPKVNAPPAKKAPGQKSAKRVASSDDVVEVPNPNAQKDKDPKQQQPQQPAAKGNGAESSPMIGQISGSGQQSVQVGQTPVDTAVSRQKLMALKRQVVATLGPWKPQPMSPTQRQRVQDFLFERAGNIRDADKAIQFWYTLIDPGNDEVAKKLIRFSEILKQQFASLNHPLKLANEITVSHNDIIAAVRDIMHLLRMVSEAVRKRNAQVAAGAGAGTGVPAPTNASGVPGAASKASMSTENKATPSGKKSKDNNKPPAAPTTEKGPSFPPFEKPTPDGVPKYPEDGKRPSFNMAIPSKRRKVHDDRHSPSSASNTPAERSPQTTKGKSPKVVANELKHKCKIETCPMSKTGFNTPAEYTAHWEAEHDDKMPDDPLAFALDHMRKAFKLDDDGKSKAAGKADKSGKPNLGPAASSGNAPRTPQSMNNTGTGSKPATPALSASKLPGKGSQTQAPPTPPQDAWAECSISAADIVGILPVEFTDAPVASTPSTTVQTSKGAGKVKKEKSQIEPKQSKGEELSNQEQKMLDVVEVKDITGSKAANGTTDQSQKNAFGNLNGNSDSFFFGIDDPMMGGNNDGFEDLFGGNGVLGEISDAMQWDTLYPDIKKDQGKNKKNPSMDDSEDWMKNMTFFQ